MSTSAPIETLLLQALAFHEKGQLREAQAIYLEILRAHPQHADSLHLLGVLAQQSGQPGAAADLIGRALQADPGQPVFFYNHGNALTELRQLEAAVASYVQAIRLQPQFAEAYASLGNAFQGLKQFDNVVAAYDRAIALKPGLAQWHFNRANALMELGQWEGATAGLAQAIELAPDFAEAFVNRGKALLELGQLPAALVSYDSAVRTKPTLAEAYVGRGHVLQALGRLDEAIADFDQAIDLNRALPEAHHNRARALQELGRLDEALASYGKAIEFKPDYAEAFSNRGNVLRELRQMKAAVESYTRAIELKPGYAQAYSNRGMVWEELDQPQAAAADFAKAIELTPDNEFLFGHFVFARMASCDWRHLDEDFERLRSGIERGEKMSPPFPLLSILDSPALQKLSAAIASSAQAPPRNVLGPIAKRIRKSRIRIGYYSADFHNHATAVLMANLFEIHDRSRFDLFALSFDTDPPDAMRRRLCAAFDRFIDVRAMNDRDVASLSRELEVDIAVDLKGFTQHGRCGIFAERAAPIQVSYLGYPGTLGMDTMDYLIADRTLIPEGNRGFYSEKIAYLPNSYQVNDPKREISLRRFQKAELGLPQAGFVFCCFNANYKIASFMFDIWMRLLHRVEGSVLWLIKSNPFSLENLRKEAGKRGVAPARLIFADRLPSAQHLARHRLADLFLDTLPYNAHTTASDALWAGVPVLTCLGQSFAARVAGSLLNAVHLPEMITHSLAQYESLALELATDPRKLAAIRGKLERERLTAPLFDTPLFARHLEASYLAMWERYEAGLPPDHLHIRP